MHADGRQSPDQPLKRVLSSRPPQTPGTLERDSRSARSSLRARGRDSASSIFSSAAGLFWNFQSALTRHTGSCPRERAGGEARGERREQRQEVPLGVDVVEAEVEDQGVIDEAERGRLRGVVLHVPRRALVLLDDRAQRGEPRDGQNSEMASGSDESDLATLLPDFGSSVSRSHRRNASAPSLPASASAFAEPRVSLASGSGARVFSSAPPGPRADATTPRRCGVAGPGMTSLFLPVYPKRSTSSRDAPGGAIRPAGRGARPRLGRRRAGEGRRAASPTSPFRSPCAKV